jgi:hypothetical protein
MTPYKILRLFKIHKAFNPDKFKPEKPAASTENMDDIDVALGGF